MSSALTEKRAQDDLPPAKQRRVEQLPKLPPAKLIKLLMKSVENHQETLDYLKNQLAVRASESLQVPKASDLFDVRINEAYVVLYNQELFEYVKKKELDSEKDLRWTGKEVKQNVYEVQTPEGVKLRTGNQSVPANTIKMVRRTLKSNAYPRQGSKSMYQLKRISYRLVRPSTFYYPNSSSTAVQKLEYIELPYPVLVYYKEEEIKKK